MAGQLWVFLLFCVGACDVGGNHFSTFIVRLWQNCHTEIAETDQRLLIQWLRKGFIWRREVIRYLITNSKKKYPYDTNLETSPRLLVSWDLHTPFYMEPVGVRSASKSRRLSRVICLRWHKAEFPQILYPMDHRYIEFYVERMPERWFAGTTLDPQLKIWLRKRITRFGIIR